MNKILFFFMVWLAAYLSSAQTNWHDPALDGVNVNLGYLNSDQNKNFEDLPERLWRTNRVLSGIEFTNETPRYQAMGVTNLNPSVSEVSSNRGAWRGMMTNAFTNFAGFATGLPLSNSFDGVRVSGTNNPWRIYFPNGAGGNSYADLDVSLTTGNHINPVFCKLIRTIIIAIEYFCLFWLIAADLKKSVSDLMDQRQIQGSQVSVLGNTPSAASGVAFAIIITTSLAVAITAVFNYALVGEVKLTGSGTQIISHLQALAAYPAWEVLTAFFPVVSTVIVASSYALFKYVFLTPLFLITRSIALWLIV